MRSRMYFKICRKCVFRWVDWWLISIATIPAAKTTRVFSCRFPCLFPLLDSAEIPSFGFYPAFLRHTYHVLCWNMLNAIPQWQVLDKIPISTIPSTEISGWNVARQASCALCLSSKPFALAFLIWLRSWSWNRKRFMFRCRLTVLLCFVLSVCYLFLIYIIFVIVVIYIW